MLYEVNKDRMKRNESLVKFSVSHAFCIGSRYKEGGLGQSFFLNIMANDGGKICLDADERISHEEFTDILRPNDCDSHSSVPPFSIFLKNMRKEIEDDAQFLHISS